MLSCGVADVPTDDAAFDVLVPFNREESASESETIRFSTSIDTDESRSEDETIQFSGSIDTDEPRSEDETIHSSGSIHTPSNHTQDTNEDPYAIESDGGLLGTLFDPEDSCVKHMTYRICSEHMRRASAIWSYMIDTSPEFLRIPFPRLHDAPRNRPDDYWCHMPFTIIL